MHEAVRRTACDRRAERVRTLRGHLRGTSVPRGTSSRTTAERTGNDEARVERTDVRKRRRPRVVNHETTERVVGFIRARVRPTRSIGTREQRRLEA